MTEWTATHESALRELAALGLGHEAIADALGVTAAEVTRRLAPPPPAEETKPGRRRVGPPGSIWTEARVAELTRLWDEGVSAAEIGRRMGVTKNVVVGKARRLSLPARPSPLKTPPRRQAARRPVIPAARSAAELPPKGCRWIEGDVPRYPALAAWCDAPVDAPGEPWCAEHRRRAWIGKPRRRSAEERASLDLRLAELDRMRRAREARGRA